MKIHSIRASQVFDSRGVPTLQTTVVLQNGISAAASVPSGASTGMHEAHEKRDGGALYAGRGVLQAAELINTEICAALKGRDAAGQRAIDAALIGLDGTPDKRRLGANALLSVSMAVCRAAAQARGVPLYRHIGGDVSAGVPLPMMNVLNGGLHADNNIDIQEFMIVPVGAESFADAMRMGTDVYRALKQRLKKDGHATSVGDEGGFAPSLKSDDAAIDLLEAAIDDAGYTPGADICVALDCAASGWHGREGYHMPKRGARMSRDEMIDRWCALAQRHRLFSVEDPLDEEDFDGFAELTRRIGAHTLVVGDDLFTTNPERLQTGIVRGAANAILIKPNQIGTLTETMDVIAAARAAGYRTIVSHRSGETCDPFIADLAVGMGAPLIKSGAPARGERLAKYNRLLEIEWEISQQAMEHITDHLRMP